MTERPDQPSQTSPPERSDRRSTDPARRPRSTQDKPQRPRHRRRRRPIRVVRAGRWRNRLILLIILIGLAVVGYLIAERIRTGDMPRAIAESVVSDALGLRVEIGGVDLAWSGQTVVRDIIVRLPLDDTPLIEIDRIDATHWHIALIGILRDPGLSDIELEGVRVLLERDTAGQWNLIEAINRIAATRPGGNSNAGAGVPGLPQLHAESITVQLRDAGRDLGQLSARFTGDPESALGYTFMLEEPTIGSMDGRFAVGGDWSHRITFELRSIGPIEELLRPMLPQADDNAHHPLAARATGRWTGQPAAGGLRGTLTIEAAEATAAGYTANAQGAAALAITNGTLSIEPQSMRLQSPQLGEAQLVSGSLRLSNGQLELTRLRTRSRGVTTDVDGTWRAADQAGNFNIAWSGANAGPVAAHHGRAKLELLLSEAGRTIVRATTDATVDIGANSLHAELDIDADALLPSRASAGVRFRRLSWSGPDQPPIELAGLEARASLADGIARLTHLNIPGATLQSTIAEYTLADSSWFVDIATVDWRVPRYENFGSVSLSAIARGQAARAEAWSLGFRNAWAAVDASGTYDPARDLPLLASTEVALRLAETSLGEPANGNAAPPLLTGGVRAQLELVGTLEPLELSGAGSVSLSDLRFRREPIEPLTVLGFGVIDDEGITFTSNEFTLLDGAASFIGSVAPDATVRARVNASQINFDELSEALGVGTRLGGRANAELEFLVPQGNAGRATLVGDWNARDLRLDPLAIDTAAGRIEAGRREARFEDISLKHDGGTISGRATYDLATEAGLGVDFEASRWPIESGDLDAILDGSIRGRIDLAQMAANLDIRGSAETRLNDVPLGEGTLIARVIEQTIALESSNIEIGGGNINATGTLPLKQWTDANFQASIENVSFGPIAQCFVKNDIAQALAELSGAADGKLVIAPNSDETAFGPLGITLNGSLIDGRFRNVDINDFNVRLAAGPERIVLESAVLHIADGTIEAWGTTTMHADERFVRINAAISRLDLDQIARSADPAMGAVPGRVSGRVVAGGYLHAPHRLFGESTMLIEESDLANVGPIAMIYNALNIGASNKEPSGRGTASIRLEGEALDVTRFEYFNRGVDVFAALRLEQVLAGVDSPINGYAGGSARPLRDLDLPFAETVDRMITTAQSDAVSVLIDGTLGNRTLRIVPFSEAFRSLSRMLGTDQPPPPPE